MLSIPSSLLENHKFDLTFKTSDGISLEDSSSGVPETMYEYVKEKGYINVFEWQEINVPNTLR